MSGSIFDVKDEQDSSPVQDTNIEQSNEQEVITQSSQEAGSTEGSSGEQSSADAKEKDVPFNEHPRWKEVYEQSKEYKERSRQYEQQLTEQKVAMARLQAQYEAIAKPKEADPDAEIIKAFAGVDPTMGQFMQKLYGKANAVDQLQTDLKELREYRSNQQKEAIKTEFNNKLSSLAESNKVPKELQAFYKSRILEEAQSNPNMEMKDVESVYKKVHGEMSAFLEAAKRTEKQSYIANKSKDVKAPLSQTKGKAIKAGGKPEMSSNPAEAKAQLIQNILNTAKASRDI